MLTRSRCFALAADTLKAMRIYTRTGDQGETGLFGNKRVPKEDLRVEAYGTVDELNAFLGLLRAEPLPADLDQALKASQG